jgi:hypothetical protein
VAQAFDSGRRTELAQATVAAMMLSWVGRSWFRLWVVSRTEEEESNRRAGPGTISQIDR